MRFSFPLGQLSLKLFSELRSKLTFATKTFIWSSKHCSFEQRSRSTSGGSYLVRLAKLSGAVMNYYYVGFEGLGANQYQF